MPTNVHAQKEVDVDLFKAVKNVLQREVIIICKALNLSLVFDWQLGYSLYDNNKQQKFNNDLMLEN
jgi:hypothetical protein